MLNFYPWNRNISGGHVKKKKKTEIPAFFIFVNDADARFTA